MNRTVNRTVVSKVLSSTIGRAIVVCSLFAVVYGFVVADRYLKDWNPDDLRAQQPAATSVLNGRQTIPEDRFAVPTPMKSRSLPIDPEPIELSANAACQPNALETDNVSDTNVVVRVSMPSIGWDGAIRILLRLNLTLCGDQPCF